MAAVPEVRRGFFYGWIVMIAAWLCMYVSAACQFSFGTFVVPLMAEYGWTKTSLSLGYTLNMIVLPVAGLLAGLVTDRIGPRLTVIIGAIIGGIAFMLLSKTTSIPYFIVMYGLLFPFGLAATYMVVTVATVRRWFMKRAALAVAIAMTGSGIGIATFMPILGKMIAAVGWRMSYVIMGCMLLVGASIGGFLLRKDPESMGQYPDGEKPDPAMLKARADFLARAERWSAREAFSNINIWFLLFAQMSYLIAILGLLGWLITWAMGMLLAAGVPFAAALQKAIWVFMAFVLMAVVARIVMSWFSDWWLARNPRHTRKPALYICVVGTGLGCLLAATVVHSYAGLWLPMMIIGWCYGTGLAVFPTYLGDLFGVVNMPTLFGYMGLFTAIFSGIGPVLFARVYDATGSLSLALWICVGLTVISAICLWLIRVPKKRAKAA